MRGEELVCVQGADEGDEMILVQKQAQSNKLRSIVVLAFKEGRFTSQQFLFGFEISRGKNKDIYFLF